MIVKAMDIQEMLTKKPPFNQKKEKKKEKKSNKIVICHDRNIRC